MQREMGRTCTIEAYVPELLDQMLKLLCSFSPPLLGHSARFLHLSILFFFLLLLPLPLLHILLILPPASFMICIIVRPTLSSIEVVYPLSSLYVLSFALAMSPYVPTESKDSDQHSEIFLSMRL